MSDHNLWKNDITNRFPTAIINEVVKGDGFEVSVDIDSVITQGSWRMSLLDAYKNVRDSLLNGEESILPKSTTAQRNALIGVLDGTKLLNIDTERDEVCFNASWIGSGGNREAFGSMWEDNSNGSNINNANNYKGWKTATEGEFDSRGIVRYANRSAGDRLVVGVRGKGSYIVAFHISVTNSGGNLTTAAIHVNGIEKTSIKMSILGNSSRIRHLASDSPLMLNVGDYVDLRLKSSSSDTIKIYQANVNVDRIERG